MISKQKNKIFIPKCFFKLFREEQKNYSIYVPIPKNKELIHIPIPLKNNGIYSFIRSSKKESIPGIVP